MNEIDLAKISKTPLLQVEDGIIKSNFNPEWAILLKEFFTFKKIVEHHNDGSVTLALGRGFDFKDEDRNLASKISKSTMENFNKNFKFIKTIADLNIILVESIKVLKQVSEQVDDYAEVSALLQHSRNKCFRLLDEYLIVECWTEGVRDSIIRFHN